METSKDVKVSSSMDPNTQETDTSSRSMQEVELLVPNTSED
jgi:hypothetical protein